MNADSEKIREYPPNPRHPRSIPRSPVHSCFLIRIALDHVIRQKPLADQVNIVLAQIALYDVFLACFCGCDAADAQILYALDRAVADGIRDAVFIMHFHDPRSAVLLGHQRAIVGVELRNPVR